MELFSWKNAKTQVENEIALNQHEKYCLGYNCRWPHWKEEKCFIAKMYTKFYIKKHKYLCNIKNNNNSYDCKESYCTNNKQYKYWSWLYNLLKC